MTARRPSRGPPLVAVFLLLSSTLMVLLPAPAAAYPVIDSTFAGGSTQASLSFGPGFSEVAGPSLRLLTNSTVSFAQVDVEGALGHANASALRDSTADFQAADTLDGLLPAGGSLNLVGSTAATWSFDASNSFGNGTFTNTEIVNGSLRISSGLLGVYTTPPVTNTGDGWGYFTARAWEDSYSDVTFNLLDGGGATLVRNIQPGTRVPFTSWERSALSVEVILVSDGSSAPPPGPFVDFIGLGQREADGTFGTGVGRSTSNMMLEPGGARSMPEPANLTKFAGNPVIPKVAASYRSAFVGQPMILRVGSAWWMYFAASTTGDYTDANIARAVSTDLVNWTVDAAPLLYNGASGFDAYGIDNPYVMRSGTGFLMFYNGWTSSTACSIGRASSPDGINWTKDGEVMAPSASGWDSYAVGMVSRITNDPVNGTQWAMWYSGTDVTTGGGFSLGLATSNDGLTWTKFFANPLLLRQPGDDQDDLRGGKQIDVGRFVYYFYSCNNAVRYNVCLAQSTTGGVTWSRVGIVLNASSVGWDSQHVADPGVVLTDNGFYVFYSGYSSGQPQIGRASGSFKPSTYSGRFELISGTTPNLVSFTKDTGNPRIANAASTYRATFTGQPMVLLINGTWTMYFTAGNGSGYAGAGIARAISGNLDTWVIDAAPLLTPTAGTNDSYAVANPYVLPDPAGSGYLMYYGAWSTAYQQRVMRATSPDGVTWTKTGEVLRKSVFGWDSFGVGMVSRVEYDDSSATWRMWYSGTASTSGGDNSLGYATSPDGINWTKYGANPVMRNGEGGGPDAGDAQGGRIIRVDGNLVYYYSCHDGNTYHACAAMSADGLSWIKAGFVLNDSLSGWDSFQVSDPMPVEAGANYYLFFAATNGPNSQIGRATGVWNPLLPGPRLADLPRGFTRFVANATVGTGGAVTYSMRSSADGVLWSSPEPLAVNDSTVTTPVRKWVEFMATFSASSTRTTFREAALSTTSSIDQGRYVDTSFSFVDPIDMLRIQPTTNGAGSIAWSVSTDGGSVWAPLEAGTDTPVTGEPLQVALEGRFFGYSSAGPSLDSLLLTVRTHGVPENVGLIAGTAGRLEVSSGPLSSVVTVTIAPAPLTAAIALALAADPSAMFVDVPLRLQSDHFGTVTLSAPQVHYTLKNPILAVFDPVVPAVAMNENSSQVFSVAAATLPGVPLNYSWWFDGQLQASNAPSFMYAANFSSAGPHTLRASVENGDLSLEWTWNVNVANVNRGPSATGTPAPGTITQSYRQKANFSAAATDPDADVLDFVWRLDGRIQTTSTGASFSVEGLPEGTHLVQLNVSDGAAAVSLNWTLILTNSPPLPVFTPVADVTVSHAQNVTLNAAATDADGDAVEYSWKLDGAVQVGTSSSFTVANPMPGNHTAEVSVYAGGQFVVHSWKITSTNSAPIVDTRAPLEDRGTDTNESQNFTVGGFDPDGDSFGFAWTLDGTRQLDVGPSFQVPAGLPAGLHIVVVTLTDTFGASVKANWSFTIPPPTSTPPPATTSSGFIPGFEAAAALAVFGAVAAVGTARRRRR